MEKKIKDEVDKISDLIFKDCKKEEIKENGFKVSFGFSIILLGVISIFFDTNNTILVGISLSSLIFTFVDAIPRKNNLLYIFPLSVLLLFCVYPDLIFIKPFLDTSFNNFIVFVSFGITFCLNAYTSYHNRISVANKRLEDDLKYQKDVESQLYNSVIILTNIVKIREICLRDEILNTDLNRVVDELYQYSQEEKTLAIIKRDLVTLSLKNNNHRYSIDEIQDCIIKSGDYQRNKIFDKMDDFYAEHQDLFDEKIKEKMK